MSIATGPGEGMTAGRATPYSDDELVKIFCRMGNDKHYVPTDEALVVHTDSQYAIGVLQKGWKAKANQELIHDLKKRMREFKRLTLVYVRGHAGVPLNERADQLARAAVASRATAGWREVKSHGQSHG